MDPRITQHNNGRLRTRQTVGRMSLRRQVLKLYTHANASTTDMAKNYNNATFSHNIEGPTYEEVLKFLEAFKVIEKAIVLLTYNINCICIIMFVLLNKSN